MARGGAVVACRAHNPKVRGSNPLPATKTFHLKCIPETLELLPTLTTLFIYRIHI
jgi:hypothetical protein